MKCQECGKVMRKVQEEYRFTESGLENVYLVGIQVFRCDDGHVTAKIPKMKDLLDAIGEAIVNKPESLTGQEVRYLRKHMGLSAVNFAKRLGVDPATFSRWENGARIGPTSDRLIRLCYAGLMGYQNAQRIINEFESLRDEITMNRIEVRRSSREGYQASYAA
ncbi:MAG: type II TA system antitoxin MqsA family protein [Nitrospinota bacterium]